ncbi:TetR/AcrR family transcriptional regulator [Actibacterium atlanticum]|uniref:TetR/AcrR family transcriptional regulator n=1 Tax=Actibacterium atlanticum TaxID=1461693 RepID=UPI001EE2F38E|nr:TetR/AcrR family transcriptional regulator [Actibacterium atlanticum]
MQQRTLKTRANLVEAARAIVLDVGYEGLRTEEVVKRASVAKGTFFAHFADKDALLELLIGEALLECLDQMAERPAPVTVPEVVEHLMPLIGLMTQSRFVFDVIVRHSGAAVVESLGPIAQSFDLQYAVFAKWFDPEGDHPFRRDVPPELLAEGIQAFAIQAMALMFCAINSVTSVEDRLTVYLNAWLLPSK